MAQPTTAVAGVAALCQNIGYTAGVSVTQMEPPQFGHRYSLSKTLQRCGPGASSTRRTSPVGSQWRSFVSAPQSPQRSIGLNQSAIPSMQLRTGPLVDDAAAARSVARACMWHLHSIVSHPMRRCKGESRRQRPGIRRLCEQRVKVTLLGTGIARPGRTHSGITQPGPNRTEREPAQPSR
jgi:hypothetical protein